jgi:hypothetical protein
MRHTDIVLGVQLCPEPHELGRRGGSAIESSEVEGSLAILNVHAFAALSHKHSARPEAARASSVASSLAPSRTSSAAVAAWPWAAARKRAV